MIEAQDGGHPARCVLVGGYGYQFAVAMSLLVDLVANEPGTKTRGHEEASRWVSSTAVYCTDLSTDFFPNVARLGALYT
jgi:hypothetical protein